MRIYVGEDYKGMSRKAANIISAQIILKPDSVMGLATGSTPIGIYDQLVKWYEKGDLDFSSVVSINLDEYKGLSGDNDQSYRYFMNKYLFDRINIKKENTHLPNGMAIDDDAECERYENVIKSVGGIDMQLLGIGLNGHIGFNEPGESFEKTTHCVELTQSTIDANSRLFHEGEKVPEKAFSMGIKSIIRIFAARIQQSHQNEKTNFTDCKWRKESTDCKRCILWTCNSKNSGIYFTVT